MEAGNEAGTDRALVVKSHDAEIMLPTSTDPSSVCKSSQSSDNKLHNYVSNVLVEVTHVNKGGALRGEKC